MKTWNFYLTATFEFKAEDETAANLEAEDIIKTLRQQAREQNWYKAWFDFVEFEEVIESEGEEVTE